MKVRPLRTRFAARAFRALVAGGPDLYTIGMPAALYVAIGGALGALARFAVGASAAQEAPTIPWSTLLVNVAGSFLLGVLLRVPAEGELAVLLRLGLGVGFCGAFTTFSTFSYEGLRMLELGHGARALGYASASVLLSLAAVAAGVQAARLAAPAT